MSERKSFVEFKTIDELFSIIKLKDLDIGYKNNLHPICPVCSLTEKMLIKINQDHNKQFCAMHIFKDDDLILCQRCCVYYTNSPRLLNKKLELSKYNDILGTSNYVLRFLKHNNGAHYYIVPYDLSSLEHGYNSLKTKITEEDIINEMMEKRKLPRNNTFFNMDDVKI